MSKDSNQISDFFLSPGRSDVSPEGVLRRLYERIRETLPSKRQFEQLPKVLSARERFLFLFFIVVGVIALLSIPVSAFYHVTVPMPAQGGSYTEGMVGIPQYINPLLLQDSDIDRDLSRLVFAGLMKQTASGSIDYDLAKNYTVSSDGLEYRFQLKDNLHWHDGVLVTADDVVFTIQAVQNPDYLSAQQITWRGVEVTKINDRTIAFTLKNRYAQFLNNMTIGIIPKHLWQSVKPSDFRLSILNIQPVGAGPFRFDSLTRDQGTISSIRFKAFPDYHFGQPHITYFIARFFQAGDYTQAQNKMISSFNAGDLDGINYLPASRIGDIRNSAANELNLKLPRYFAIFFNQSRSRVLSDQNVRQALNYATDRSSFVKTILNGRGETVTSPLLPGIISVRQPTKEYGFDLEKAASLLERAGWHMASDGFREKTYPSSDKNTPAEPTRLTIELTTRDSPELVAAANLLRDQWKKIGVELVIKTASASEIAQHTIKERNYEALLYGEVLGLNPDPFSFWHSSQKKEPGLNLALYDNASADKILEEARQNMDFGRRLQSYSSLQDIILADAPAVFLYSPDYVYMLSPRVKGIRTSVVGIPADRFNDVFSWYLNTKRVRK